MLDNLSIGQARERARRRQARRGRHPRAARRALRQGAPRSASTSPPRSTSASRSTRPDYDAAINVLGTIRVLEAAREHGAQVVFSSTGGAIYGECEGPAPEDGRARPLSPYGTSKLAAEEYLASYNRLYGSGHVVAAVRQRVRAAPGPARRGGRGRDLLQLLRDGETPRIYGDGRQTRDYVYVGDVVRATLAAAEHDGGVYNVGTGRETSVLELYDLCRRVAGTRSSPSPLPAARRAPAQCPGRSLAGRELGWRPEQSLEDGLRRDLGVRRRLGGSAGPGEPRRPVEFSAPSPLSALVRPWRTATLVAGGVAAFELVLLLIIGIALLSKPLSAHAKEAATKREVGGPIPSRPEPKRVTLSRRETSVLVLNGNGIPERPRPRPRVRVARLPIAARATPPRATGRRRHVPPRPPAGGEAPCRRDGRRARRPTGRHRAAPALGAHAAVVLGT